MDRLYTVSELAEDLGVTPRAIRFYEDKGLIAPRRAGNNRIYTGRDRGRLILILRGKRLGFTLREIGEWLDLYDADPDHIEQARLLGEKIEKRIAVLELQRKDLEETIEELREIRTQVREYLTERRNGKQSGRPAAQAL